MFFIVLGIQGFMELGLRGFVVVWFYGLGFLWVHGCLVFRYLGDSGFYDFQNFSVFVFY